jgi:hypothetical protein
MRIIALLFAFALTGCAGDRLQHAVKSRQQWKWVEITDTLVRDRLEQKGL